MHENLTGQKSFHFTLRMISAIGNKTDKKFLIKKKVITKQLSVKKSFRETAELSLVQFHSANHGVRAVCIAIVLIQPLIILTRTITNMPPKQLLHRYRFLLRSVVFVYHLAVLKFPDAFEND